MYALAAIGILGVIGILALLTWWNEKTMARTLAPYLARPKAELPDNLPAIFFGGAVGRPMGAAGHSVRPYRSEVALAPVQWHDDGALLPALPEPPTVRIGGRPQPATPATAENWTPARTPAIESDFAVPALQTLATGLAVALGAGLVSWALSWSWRVPVAVGGLALVAAWFWRQGVADSLLWQLETWAGKDLNGDGVPGRPQMSFTLANPGQARQAVAQEARQTAQSAEQTALASFLDRCFMVGCGEHAHGVKASGPDRQAYIARRDALMGLGLAAWKSPGNAKAGWKLTASRQRARQTIAKHVL